MKEAPEPELGSSYEGLLARGKAGLYGHIAVRLGDRLDLRGDVTYKNNHFIITAPLSYDW